VRPALFFAALLVSTASYAQDHVHESAPATAPADTQTTPDDPHAPNKKPAKAALEEPSRGNILYYKNPMGGSDTSPVPKKDSMGMDYVPVYAGDADAKPQPTGRVLFYKNPMGGSDTSPVPKKDSMGMDYIPVHESEVPPTITDHAADRVYAPQAMAAARGLLKEEHGGGTTSLVMINILELQVRKGNDGYRWDGEAWYGNDSNRAVLKFKGEGEFKGPLGNAEVQALYARPIGTYFNLQAGVRYDINPDPSRAYATIGFEGLAPYWFKVGGALFVSNKGDAHARLEGYYDLNITQRLILQPRAEVDIAAQKVPELKTGAGISTVEAELRLRYEIRREFAPYIGVTYERKTGRTADYARAAGEPAGVTSFVAGVKLFF
jgi:copper resistance protein B